MIPGSTDSKRGGASVRGRLQHMLKGTRRIKKEPGTTQGQFKIHISTIHNYIIMKKK